MNDERGVRLADANARLEQEAGADYPVAGDEGFEPLPDEQYGQEPTPVYLIEPPPRSDTIVSWDALTVTLATDRKDQVLADDNRRTRATLVNTDATNSVILVPSEFSLATGGRVIPPGGDLEMAHNRAVWAYAMDGTPSLTVHTERVVEDS